MTRRLRLLVVEDDAIVAEIYRLSIERAGIEFLGAADGEAGLEIARTAHPDLVYLDVRLPKLDGMEVLRRLAGDEATRDIPVVMLSNYDDPPLIRSSLALGAKEYLVKVNIDPTELAAIARRWIGQQPAVTETAT